VLVVGGSSALFAIDTRTLTDEFRVTFVNIATHVRLPLEVQLDNALGLARGGDAVILALEPGYYCGPDDDSWYTRNAIAWRPEAWRAMPVAERARALWKAGPWFLAELAMARLTALVAAPAIGERLEALDDAATLRRFAARSRATEFGYSLANLDELGNIRRTEGSRPLRREGFSANTPLGFCGSSKPTLEAFAQRARAAGVLVRFAYSPFMEAPAVSGEAIAAGARDFEQELSRIAPLLGSRPMTTFPHGLFFDTGLHLNAEGRRIRTALLAAAIRADGAMMAALGGRI